MHAFRIFFSLVFLVTGVFAEDAYEVRMARPVKAGHRSKVTAKVAFQSEATTSFDANTVVPEKIDAACKVAGELTVVQVTAKGLPKELLFKITEVESFEDGEKADLFSTGDVVTLKYGRDKNEVTINGEEAAETEGELVQALFDVAGDDEATVDEGFGTKEKVKVGDEWGANLGVVSEEMARQGIEGIKKEEIKAKTKLSEQSTVDGQPALRFVSELKFDTKTAKVRQLGEDMQTKRVKTDIRSEMDLPVDVNSLAVHGRSMMTMELEAKGVTKSDDGASLSVSVVVKRRAAVDATETPIK